MKRAERCDKCKFFMTTDETSGGAAELECNDKNNPEVEWDEELKMGFKKAGECHRRAPATLPLGAIGLRNNPSDAYKDRIVWPECYEAGWPIVMVDDWCGEFEDYNGHR